MVYLTEEGSMELLFADKESPDIEWGPFRLEDCDLFGWSECIDRSAFKEQKCLDETIEETQ
jgi:hypothetical protein